MAPDSSRLQVQTRPRQRFAATQRSLHRPSGIFRLETPYHVPNNCLTRTGRRRLLLAPLAKRAGRALLAMAAKTSGARRLVC
jgi:hypothetical protein